MLRISGSACRRATQLSHLKKISRTNHVAAPVASEHNSALELLQQNLREKVLAEALAKEEEAMLRAKALRELKEQTKLALGALNFAPKDAIADRLAKLQNQLDSLPDQAKVKQLDEEIEEFLFQAMHVPASEARFAPWSRASHMKKSGLNSPDLEDAQTIRTTANTGFSHQFPNLKPTPDYKPYSEQELFLRHMAHVTHSGHLGSVQKDVYDPSSETLRPRHISDLSIANLMAAECHLGHAKQLWRPSTQPFIYGEYNGIHLIDLNHTIVALRKAAKVVKAVAAKGGIVLYVGTTRHKEQQTALEEAARRSSGYCVTHRWIPGTITNFTEVSRQIQGPQTVSVDLGDVPTGKYYTTTEGTVIKPDLIVLMNPVDNRNCIGESIKSRIPTIGLCDTNMEPSLLTYPIPCNDDSTRASSLILGILSRAGEEGVKERRSLFAQYKQNQAFSSQPGKRLSEGKKEKDSA